MYDFKSLLSRRSFACYKHGLLPQKLVNCMVSWQELTQSLFNCLTVCCFKTPSHAGFMRYSKLPKSCLIIAVFLFSQFIIIHLRCLPLSGNFEDCNNQHSFICISSSSVSLDFAIKDKALYFCLRSFQSISERSKHPFFSPRIPDFEHVYLPGL